MSEVRVEREPKYKNEDAPFEIREEYRHAYAVYGYFDEEKAECKATPEFLGVAFYNFDYKKLVADKIFRRTDENL